MTAREIIYEKDYAVDSQAVENLLKEESLVPTIVSMIEIKFLGLTQSSCHRIHSPRG
jgi:hypothetical protein